jgi:glycosyltransferase involved in cell wall biosynthesis
MKYRPLGTSVEVSQKTAQTNAASLGRLNASTSLLEGVSVIVPVYCSESILPSLVERIAPILRELTGRYELIFVNDGSSDGSWEVIQQVADLYPWVCGINLMRNYGQHNALLCGIRAARYQLCITMDDDLQHPPEEIPKLLAKLKEGNDVVYGVPLEEQHGFWRDAASQVTKLVLQNAMGADTARQVTAFRAFRTQVRHAFTAYSGPFVSIDVLLTWGAKRFCSLPVRHEPRTVGVSGYNFRKLFTHSMNMMTGFSSLPLRAATFVGFGFTLFGVAVLAYVVIRYVIHGSSVPGFPFLASMIAIFSGAQLFALGIMGEYLARMHFRIMDRAPYTVRSVTDEENHG